MELNGAVKNMRLIDANELKKSRDYLNKGRFDYPDKYCNIEADDFISAIDDTPTIDAVPVIRCADCACAKIRSHEEFPLYCTRRGESAKYGVHYSDFCNYGERRT